MRAEVAHFDRSWSWMSKIYVMTVTIQNICGLNAGSETFPYDCWALKGNVEECQEIDFHG